jgi:phage-related protein
MADLPIQPDYSSSLNKQPRVRKVGFGDNYEQRTADGLNHNPDKWTLTWDELTDDEIKTLLDFFDGLGGVATFSWQSLYATAPKKYVCEKWDPTPVSDNNHRLSASIYQVNEP